MRGAPDGIVAGHEHRDPHLRAGRGAARPRLHRAARRAGRPRLRPRPRRLERRDRPAARRPSPTRADAEDVAAAVRAARTDGFPFTVRGGGHSVSGRSVRNGALCIDLRGLNAVERRPTERGRARAAVARCWASSTPRPRRTGSRCRPGQISHTGVGGLTLGGGLGWLMRHHGLTIDSLLSAEVVLADGRLVRASAGEHPDLFWALRGGGGDFGVVTSFEFRAHRVGPVLAGLLVYPWERAREAFRASRELMAGAPDALTLFDVLLTAPPGPPFPPELQGQRVMVIGVGWSGDVAKGERAARPAARCLPAGARPRRRDAVPGAADDARRDRAARRAVLRPPALSARDRRRVRRRPGRGLRARADAAGARDDCVARRSDRPRRARRDRLRPPWRAGADVDHRRLGRRAGRRRSPTGCGACGTTPSGSPPAGCT